VKGQQVRNALLTATAAPAKLMHVGLDELASCRFVGVWVH
jgi:hypothetical protein